MKQRKTLATVLALAAFAIPMIGQSAVITQTAGGSTDWTDPAVWDGNPISSANDYVTDAAGGSYLRMSASGGDTTFSGNSLTVTTRALLKTQTATTTINGDLILDGGWFSFAANAGTWNPTFAANSFNVIANSTMSSGGYIYDATIDATLTGSGDLTLYLENAAHATADQSISFAGISGYTGALTVTEKLGIEFGTDYTFNNTVTLQDADSFLNVNSGQTLTFAEGMLVDSVNGTVASGTYTGAALDALGANYVNNGGSIVVIPEPATLGLVGIFGAGMLVIRHRFMI